MLPRSIAVDADSQEASPRPSTPLALEASCRAEGFLLDGGFAFPDDLGIHNAQVQPIDGDGRQPIDLDFDELFAFEEDTSGQHQFSADVSMSLQYDKTQQSGSWCAWMRGNISLAVVNENHLSAASSSNDYNSAVALQSKRPHAHHNADLIIQSLRSFPTMMTRRETFPWFIHPHSRSSFESTEAVLPDALSNCMSIAQIFAARTTETKAFLRQTIRAEYHRFGVEV